MHINSFSSLDPFKGQGPINLKRLIYNEYMILYENLMLWFLHHDVTKKRAYVKQKIYLMRDKIREKLQTPKREGTPTKVSYHFVLQNGIKDFLLLGSIISAFSPILIYNISIKTTLLMY